MRLRSHVAGLWHKLAAASLIQPLAWELPFAAAAALKRKKKKKKKRERERERKKILPILSVKKGCHSVLAVTTSYQGGFPITQEGN